MGYGLLIRLCTVAGATTIKLKAYGTPILPIAVIFWYNSMASFAAFLLVPLRN